MRFHASQKESEKSHFKNRINLHEITALMTEDQEAKRRKDVSEATVNRKLACLKSMIDKAVL